MPIDPGDELELTAYRWVPDMARGYVKDMRVRWALEEIGIPCRVRLVGGAGGEKSREHLADQPFGQVPVLKAGNLTLFESGAILTWLGEQDDRLLPRDPAGRARAIGWVFAALNSVEPFLQSLFLVRHVGQGADWQAPAVEAVKPFSTMRLGQLSAALGSKEWLEDRFTIGDIAMADVLRAAPDEARVSDHPNLAAYVERATARPAFARAMAAQLANFQAEPA